MATVKHIHVNTLPDVLEPGAIYFVRSTGQIVQTDLNGVPVEYGGKDFYAVELYGELNLGRKNIPSGHDRDHAYMQNGYRIIQWTWGDFDRLVKNLNNSANYYKGWWIPEGYRFVRLRITGGYTQKCIPNWSVYLIRKTVNTTSISHGVVGVFPVELGCDDKSIIYNWYKKYDIANHNIITESDDMYAVMMLSDNIDNTDPDQMHVHNFILRFELEKI